MSGRFWIKLWVDVLQDRKMAFLPDRLWRRYVELLLVAKAEDERGVLPDLFWTARQLGLSQEELESDLVELGKVGLVSQEGGLWLIPNYVERQTAKGGRERVRQYRLWEGMKRTRNGPETDSARGRGRGEAEEESEAEGEAEVDSGFGVVVRTWEKACGPITPLIAERLGDLADEAESHRCQLPAESAGGRLEGAGWVVEAILEAASSSRTGGFNVKFVEAILSRWLREGFKASRERASRDRGSDIVDTWLAGKKHGES